MNFEDMKFPLYRKYKNGKSYFKIINPRQFEEIQIIGSMKVIKLIDAKVLPELNFVRDLVMDYHNMATEISAEEFEAYKP